MKKEKKEKKEKKDKCVKKGCNLKGLHSHAEDTERTVDQKLDEVIGGINILAGAVTKLVERQTSEVRVVEKKGEDKESKFEPTLDDETYPHGYVPKKFREHVDKILSKDFGIRVTDFPDRTDFQLDIIVPDKYSSVSKDDREKGVKDIRTRVIPRSMGENGVKEWCMLIRKNLNKYYVQEGVEAPFKNLE